MVTMRWAIMTPLCSFSFSNTAFYTVILTPWDYKGELHQRRVRLQIVQVAHSHISRIIVRHNGTECIHVVRSPELDVSAHFRIDFERQRHPIALILRLTQKRQTDLVEVCVNVRIEEQFLKNENDLDHEAHNKAWKQLVDCILVHKLHVNEVYRNDKEEEKRVGARNNEVVDRCVPYVLVEGSLRTELGRCSNHGVDNANRHSTGRHPHAKHAHGYDR